MASPANAAPAPATADRSCRNGSAGPSDGLRQSHPCATPEHLDNPLEQWKREGIVQGRRELLRSQAEVRFGTPTAERLFAALQREDDPQRLDAIGKAVVRCGTADELLRQVNHRT